MEPVESDVLISEIDGAIARLIDAPIVDQKKEFTQNVYPLLKMVVESLGSRLDQFELAIHELLTGADSMLTPEVAAQIKGVLELGVLVVSHLERLAAEETKENAEAKAHAMAYVAAARHLADAIDAMTVEPMDEEEEEAIATEAVRKAAAANGTKEEETVNG